MREIARFQFITEDQEELSHAEQAEQACQGGARWIQLRTKGREFREWKQIARSVQAVCEQYKATFIVNDNVQIAKEVDAHGVHLGKHDMPHRAAREILGQDKIIGGSSNTPEDVEKLCQAQVNYMGVGPFRFTQTKENLNPVLGHSGVELAVQRARELCPEMPLIGIGGGKEGAHF